LNRRFHIEDNSRQCGVITAEDNRLLEFFVLLGVS
jgi:hypothetical protein